ncbi:hypothetical protein BDA99DRAFT_507809 [Phascolomyces articulosus]|uniref:Uncharacterized protein n=1 Tax=Phascolomyces articulosus TaxID=60185 RepID=A0AAD5K297_9FUNG|nr:hypothetical protein BDA99DRAFT_507809 [Phascolomyces articulosus]
MYYQTKYILRLFFWKRICIYIICSVLLFVFSKKEFKKILFFTLVFFSASVFGGRSLM